MAITRDTDRVHLEPTATKVVRHRARDRHGAHCATFDFPFDAACEAVRESQGRWPWPEPVDPPPTLWERLLRRLGRTGESGWRRRIRSDRSRPRPTDLLDWLLAQPGEGVVDVSDYRAPGVMNPAAERLVESGSFQSALCVRCDGAAWYAPAEVTIEPYAYNDGFLASGSGRQWLCPKGHHLFAVLDLQS